MYSFIHAFIHSSIHPFIHFIHVIHLVRISFEFHSLHLVQSFMKFFTYVVTSGVLSSFLYFDIYKLCTGLIVYLIISETYRRIKHERYIHMYRCTYIYIYIHTHKCCSISLLSLLLCRDACHFEYCQACTVMVLLSFAGCCPCSCGNPKSGQLHGVQAQA